LPKVQATDAGRYRLRVVSDLGTVFSDWATLTVTAVDDTPTISKISAQTTPEDTATGPIAFTVGDVETAATSLTVTATSSNQALVAAAGIALGGNGSNRTITLTPVANASGTSTITVTVADGTGGLTATRSFVLTVTAVDDTPTISEISAQTTPEDTATGPIAFTVGDVETAATSLTVTATSSNQALVAAAGIALGGSGSNRTITLTPVANASGTSTITVTVADGTGGLTATRSFVLTVSGGPLVTPESLALRVVGPMVAGRMELEIRAPKGVTVSLEASVDLNTWNEAQSLTGQGSAQPLTLTPAIAPEEGTRFWRLRVR